MKNKKAWIKIVEAFTAVLLVAIVLLIVINSEYIKKEDISIQVYNIQISILREIQFNKTLRAEILNVTAVPLEWDDFPLNLKDKINERTPNYLECNARICSSEDVCDFTGIIDKDIYAESVLISATLESGYRPKQLKLFCWVK